MIEMRSSKAAIGLGQETVPVAIKSSASVNNAPASALGRVENRTGISALERAQAASARFVGWVKRRASLQQAGAIRQRRASASEFVEHDRLAMDGESGMPLNNTIANPAFEVMLDGKARSSTL
jgi:hypothetical protein